jgi:hypothetical protein
MNKMRAWLGLFALAFALIILHYYIRHRTRLNTSQIPYWLSKSPIRTKTDEIPLLIHQTYFDKSRIPQKVQDNFSKFAPGYERRIYDDEEIRGFLKEHFDSKVLKSFDELKFGAHKADLFRYCVLYVHGGVYMDIKTELVRPLEGLFPQGSITTVMSNSSQVYQGVIASPPSQPIFLHLIEGIVNSGSKPPYNLFIKDFMRYIKFDAGSPHFGEMTGKSHNYKLYQEICTNHASDCYDGLDRYKKCCKILENSHMVIKSRYAEYPW